MKINKYVILLFIAWNTSCNKDKGPFIVPDQRPNTEISQEEDDEEETSNTETISYKTDVQEIFDRRCISCHNQWHNLNLETCCSYEALLEGGNINIINPAQSKLYLMIKLPNPQMPYYEEPLKQEEIDKILKWIEEGAKKN